MNQEQFWRWWYDYDDIDDDDNDGDDDDDDDDGGDDDDDDDDSTWTELAIPSLGDSRPGPEHLTISGSGARVIFTFGGSSSHIDHIDHINHIENISVLSKTLVSLLMKCYITGRLMSLLVANIAPFLLKNLSLGHCSEHQRIVRHLMQWYCQSNRSVSDPP